IKDTNGKNKFNPYIFRHSRGTKLHKQYREAIAKKMMGHAPDSKWASTYVHLNEEDVLEVMKQEHKIKTTKEHTIQNKTPHTQVNSNPYESSICSKCKKRVADNETLNSINKLEKINKLLKLVDIIEKNPEIMHILGNAEWQNKEAETPKFYNNSFQLT
ncbi:MAG: hypothetical protein KAR20_23150, partial [Candidatus Heimdallarchaeota archaeon]|nr:hypothetical protein [Candidatus Heimdallarchaeota archaeon]